MAWQVDPVVLHLHTLLDAAPHVLRTPEGPFVFTKQAALGIVGKMTSALAFFLKVRYTIL